MLSSLSIYQEPDVLYDKCSYVSYAVIFYSCFPSIEQAEGEWVRIAGLRFHASFPNRLRSCDDVCGCSQFPFTANDALPAGIPLAVTQGSQVRIPRS